MTDQAPDALQPAKVRHGIVEALDLDRERRRRAVEDGAGREDARGEDQPGLLIFGRGEDFPGVVRRVVDGGHAISERRGMDPILLGDDQLAAHRAMPMGVDQAGDDGLARDVDRARSGGIVDRGGRADRGNAIAVDQDGAVLDHLVAAHGDDPRAGQRKRAARLGGVGGETEARVDRRRRRLAAGESAAAMPMFCANRSGPCVQ